VNKKQIRELMMDFKQYAIVLLAIGTFLYVGMVIPDEYVSRSSMEEYALLGATTLLFIFSILCFSRSLKYKKQLENMDE